MDVHTTADERTEVADLADIILQPLITTQKLLRCHRGVAVSHRVKREADDAADENDD